MLKLLAKIAEKYAKFATTECYIFWFHEPKMPRSLIK
jgi:cyclic lactone autoinducer peptide